MEENVSPDFKKKKKRYTANNPFPLCILLIYLASIVFLAVQYFCLKKNILHKDKMLSIGQWVTKDSVQFSQSVVSNSLRPHGLQHARPPCPSPAPGVYPNSSPLSQWCHPTISFSVIPFSSHLQSFPASGSLTMSQLFTSGSQSIGVSASTSVLPVNTQDWSLLRLTGWISLQSKVLSNVFLNTTVQKHQFFGSDFFIVQLTHPYMTTGKSIALTKRTCVGKVMSLLFNMLVRQRNYRE